MSLHVPPGLPELVLSGPTVVDPNGWRAYFFDDTTRARFTLQPGCVFGRVPSAPPGFTRIVLTADTVIIANGFPCSVNMDDGAHVAQLSRDVLLLTLKRIAGYRDDAPATEVDILNRLVRYEPEVTDEELTEIIAHAIDHSITSYGVDISITAGPTRDDFVHHATANAVQQILLRRKELSKP